MSDDAHVFLVPFNAAGLTSGVARGPGAIAAAGLADLPPLRGATHTWIPVDGMTTDRGPSGLRSEAALTATVTATATAVGAAWDAGRVPIIVAGDCPILLAPLIAADRDLGLVFIDGHEDGWDPHVTPSGEASDCEMALALGLSEGPAALNDVLPCLEPHHTLMIGARDADEIRAGGATSLASRVRLVPGDAATTTPVADLREAVRATAAQAPAGWWLHVDLDVLSTEALGAVDYPQPGGLTWERLDEISSAVAAVGGCRGASVVIYNPDLDGGTAAPRIARYVAAITAEVRRER
jgi:arginase